ncbi:MAG: flagellar hook protein FlgE [Deltaproteobacteria bacterium]|nr:flagellar hook protein FlgE [Deltaproteobacteria bacterium]
MGILNSLYIGASGMTAHGGAISIVGDNISNSSTIGYKRMRAQFSDVLGGTLDGHRLGSGVRLGGTQTRYDQGQIQQTGSSLDVAIRGKGFFLVKGEHDGRVASYYSRDGQFHVDEQGYVVGTSGLRLQGYLVDAAGVQGTAATDMQIAGKQSPPQATTSAKLSLNLDSGAVPPAAWDPTDPQGTSSYATSATVYDSLGTAHRVDVYMRAQGAGAWEYHAMVDGGQLTGGTAGVPTEIASGSLTFNASGALDTQTTGASSASFIGATPNQAIDFNFGDPIAAGGTGVAGTTQYSGPSVTNANDIDGHSAGKLVDVAVHDDGTLEGVFDNGEQRPLARIALAMFGSEDGLTRAGDGLFAETAESGQPLVDVAGSGGRGGLSGGALEGSNVDLGEELVTLIAYQRAFQGNARTVTTADEMLQEVSNLKR